MLHAPWACPGHSICLRQQAKTQNNDEDSGPTCKVLNTIFRSGYMPCRTHSSKPRRGTKRRSATRLQRLRARVNRRSASGNAKDWQQGNYCVAQATCLAGTIATSTRMHVTLEDMPAVCLALRRMRLGSPATVRRSQAYERSGVAMSQVAHHRRGDQMANAFRITDRTLNRAALRMRGNTHRSCMTHSGDTILPDSRRAHGIGATLPAPVSMVWHIL